MQRMMRLCVMHQHTDRPTAMRANQTPIRRQSDANQAYEHA